VAGDDGDVVAGGGEGDGEGVYVSAEAADQDRRILPGEHQDPVSAGGADVDYLGVR
jgi:hypothetical protein